MDDQDRLIQEIESYCKVAGIAESTFGRQAVNDGKFVGRLRDGKGVTTTTVAKVRRFLTDREEALIWTQAAPPQTKLALAKPLRARPIKTRPTQQASPLQSRKERPAPGHETEIGT